MIFYKGVPSKPTEEQEWAILKLREYAYRRAFGLSKIEMEAEPYEDFVINEEIIRLFQEKVDRENRKLNKHGRH